MRVYTFSYQNPTRATAMRTRFALEDLELEFVPPVEPDDARLVCAPHDQRRTWAIMWSHLDMLKIFLESYSEVGLFCEDDILIRKGLKQLLPEIIATYKRLGLEILLLGYLLNFRPVQLIGHAEFSPQSNYSYLNYPDHLWGSQMYMLDRRTAKKFLSRYTVEFARSATVPFSPDWTLTKEGRRALIYPMLAVEEGRVATDHQGQIEFHRLCAEAQLDSNYH
uniref:Glycosyltransferase n=1 Tax=viral metagenome TaxID=1070528 RepID=A0A6C0DWB3_9ZZZZ